jgi:hypothetical protein
MRSHVLGALAAAASLYVSAVATPGADAAPIIFREGITNDYVTNYAGTEDTEVFIITAANALNDNNFGARTELASVNSTSRRRFLMAFDLSSLTGVGAAVQSATLTLTKSSNASAVIVTTPNLVTMVDIVSANAGWEEGTGTGVATGLDGEATGNHKARPGTTWSSGGKLGLNAADFNGGFTADATGEYRRSDPAGTQVQFTVPAALVQSWIDNPAANAGIFFYNANDVATDLSGNPVGANSTVIFASGEHANESWRPTLTIDAVVPEPGVLGLAAAGLPLLLARRRRAH